MAPSDVNEIAAAIATVRDEMNDVRSTTLTLESFPETTIIDKYACAFDIDGVLTDGGVVIHEAIEGMKVLNGQNK